MSAALVVATGVCLLFVFLATVPVFVGIYQFLLVPLSLFRTRLERSDDVTPRVAVLVPAWNEDAVVGTTIDRLMALDYPEDALRVYVIDDASSDDTPRIAIAKAKEYPGKVVHIRRVAGGEGKAHTLNYGLDVLLRGSWTEAILIMDADVIYAPDSLRKMARHLANPEVGAVTAYIKEGSRAPNVVQRYVTFEYITATGASRRAQNVLGFLACLSGGAQLHSRANIEAIGGQIFCETLAEDTFTTFRTQLRGRAAIFEPNALVYAEEPDSLRGLWKQRVRWGRGNVQITSVFRRLWFNRRRHSEMGSSAMALIWFSIFLMPIFQIGAAAGLLGLYAIDDALAWAAFRALWIISGVAYLVVTLVSLVVDFESARKSWGAGLLFPGVISLVVIVYSLAPGLLAPVATLWPTEGPLVQASRIFLYAWVALSMLAAYGAMRLEETRFARFAPWALHLAGYGPFLCAVTFASYIKELTGAAMKWDKTVKTGKVG